MGRGKTEVYAKVERLGSGRLREGEGLMGIRYKWDPGVPVVEFYEPFKWQLEFVLSLTVCCLPALGNLKGGFVKERLKVLSNCDSTCVYSRRTVAPRR